jgi:integrase
MASIHKLPDQPNWICFYSDATGARRCKSTKTTNKKEAQTICASIQKTADLARNGRLTEEKARRVIESVVSDIMESVGGELKRFTIEEYFESWLAARQNAGSVGTFTRYRGIVTAFENFLGSKKNMSLGSLRSDDIQTYRDALARKVSTGTVNTHLKVLRVALGRAVLKKQIETNPAKYVENLDRVDKHERRAFTMDELKKLLSNASEEWRTMVLVGLYTGLRLGDVATLTWANLDLQQQELTVKTQKTARVQILPLAKPLLRHLETLPTGDYPKTPLCPSLFDKTSTCLSNQFYELMASVGLVKTRNHQAGEDRKGRSARRAQSAISFHALRHTATSLLKNAGVSDVVARDIIGHESEAVSRSYTHIDMETKRKAIELIPDISPQ